MVNNYKNGVNMKNKNLIGILALILGILLIAFPILGTLSLTYLAGISFILLGIHFLLVGIHVWGVNKVSSVINIILGILALILGGLVVGNMLLFSFVVSYYLWIVAFLLILTGLNGLITRESTIGRTSSIVLMLCGVLSLILGLLAIKNPLYVGLLIGIGLILDGIYFILVKSPVEDVLVFEDVLV